MAFICPNKIGVIAPNSYEDAQKSLPRVQLQSSYSSNSPKSPAPPSQFQALNKKHSMTTDSSLTSVPRFEMNPQMKMIIKNNKKESLIYKHSNKEEEQVIEYDRLGDNESFQEYLKENPRAIAKILKNEVYPSYDKLYVKATSFGKVRKRLQDMNKHELQDILKETNFKIKFDEYVKRQGAKESKSESQNKNRIMKRWINHKILNAQRPLLSPQPKQKPSKDLSCLYISNNMKNDQNNNSNNFQNPRQFEKNRVRRFQRVNKYGNLFHRNKSRNGLAKSLSPLLGTPFSSFEGNEKLGAEDGLIINKIHTGAIQIDPLISVKNYLKCNSPQFPKIEFESPKIVKPNKDLIIREVNKSKEPIKPKRKIGGSQKKMASLGSLGKNYSVVLHSQKLDEIDPRHDPSLKITDQDLEAEIQLLTKIKNFSPKRCFDNTYIHNKFMPSKDCKEDIFRALKFSPTSMALLSHKKARRRDSISRIMKNLKIIKCFRKVLTPSIYP
ncbi:unnamed protein product [Moneuplotes crassus]|uniref:Uncharacterized protein n=1 Tax=Euplotes crassus TaxID=5936 RepID=A0AAD1X441_EUPCR|nr:unnamed protein product [Moneuplotes crassus]